MKASPGLAVVAVLLAACAGGTAPAAVVSTVAPASPPSTPVPGSFPADAPSSSAVAAEGTIDGMFDVGGHSLYLRCVGTGSPTIVYLHGAIWEPSMVPHRNGTAFQDRLGAEYRVCVYDRRNVGLSDRVDAPQGPEEPSKELEALLGAAGVEPPYVLLGASFGGLLAYHFMSTHPDDVVGMVLLDAIIPNELEMDSRYPPKERQDAFIAEDECCSPERLAHFKVFEASSAYLGKEPAIPVRYLASAWEQGNAGRPELRATFEALRDTYLAGFSPGELEWVDAPHFMEPAVPGEIEAALREVIALATQ